MAKTRSQKRQQREARKAAIVQPQTMVPVARTDTSPAEPKLKAVRPTPQRLAKGSFRMPSGPLRQHLPAHDEAHDAVAKLHRAKLLTDDQEHAAREWQDLKAAVRAELQISQGRSCLDISPVGYDDGDGDPAVMQRWRRVEAELGSWRVGALDFTCVLGHPPANLDLLRSALDQFSSL